MYVKRVSKLSIGLGPYHFSEKDLSILGKLYITSTTDEPIHKVKHGLYMTGIYILRVPLGPRLVLMTFWRP